ncbi:MAG: hypothetical protein KF726_20410 [Anaerolineae bacterium]|nr:hypothetical protein [Anaerolineae bacterium]
MSTSVSSDSPSARKRLLYFLGFALVIIAIVGVTIYAIYNDLNSRFNGPRHEAKAVAPNVIVSQFLTFEEDRTFPMGLTASPDGGFYLSRFNASGISKVNAEGKIEAFAVTGSATGALAFNATDGNLYAVVYNEATQNAVGSLVKIDSEGLATELPAIPNQNGLPLFAGLALDPAGNVYVTDPIGGQVWRYPPNAAVPELWWTAATVSNQRAIVVAITYDPTREKMLVSDVGTGTVYAVAMDGSEAQPLYRQTGIDVRAITVDEKTNRLFLTVWNNDNGAVNLLQADGSLLLLADDFRSPTATVLLDDKLYVVNSDVPGLIQSSGLVQPRAKPPFTVDVLDLSNLQ